MSDRKELDALIEACRNAPRMTEKERAIQRINFAYGNVALSYPEDHPSQKALIEWRDERLAQIEDDYRGADHD